MVGTVTCLTRERKIAARVLEGRLEYERLLKRLDGLVQLPV
jgi:hypothetical protein